MLIDIWFIQSNLNAVYVALLHKHATRKIMNKFSINAKKGLVRITMLQMM